MVRNIEWKDRRVHVDYDGATSDTEVLAVVEIIQSDRRFDNLCEALHDFSQCDGCEHSESTLLHISALNNGAKMSNDRLRIAVVAVHEDIKEMVRSFEDLGYNPYPIAIFDSCDQANAWLRGDR